MVVKASTNVAVESNYAVPDVIEAALTKLGKIVTAIVDAE